MGEGRIRNGSRRRAMRGAVPIAELVADAIGDVCRRRGFAGAEILTWWPEIVGAERARTCEPERILWPRRDADPDIAGERATLVLRTTGSQALFVQQDAPRIIEQVNIFLGYPAIGRIKIVQRPIIRAERPQRRKIGKLPEPVEAALKARLKAIENDELRAGLARLGRAVLAGRMTEN